MNINREYYLSETALNDSIQSSLLSKQKGKVKFVRLINIHLHCFIFQIFYNLR